MKNRRNLDNLLRLYDRADAEDRAEGRIYYPRQLERLERRAGPANLPLTAVAGAFAALSPNNAEKTNYIALDIAIRVVSGELPESAGIPAYPINRTKALRILRGEEPGIVLKGNKVRSFYYNTIDPNTSEVTIDGHMFNAWRDRVTVLHSRELNFGDGQYARIASDFRAAAFWVGLRAPEFQATLWLTWKRVNRILWNPQQSFEF